MSTAADSPAARPGAIREVEEQRGARNSLGLGTATALIVGSIIGVGIFNLPASLAAYGPISLLAMALTTVGALALAYMFASLTRRLPADGGPYAYARAAFGNFAGFSNAWLYWITAWSGNAAIVVGWVLYVQEFVNKDANKLFSILLALVGLWLPAAINLNGVKSLDPGLFPAGSMGPKVEAAAQFARTSGNAAVIGSLEQLSSILAGHGGTRISVQAEGMETR